MVPGFKIRFWEAHIGVLDSLRHGANGPKREVPELQREIRCIYRYIRQLELAMHNRQLLQETSQAKQTAIITTNELLQPKTTRDRPGDDVSPITTQPVSSQAPTTKTRRPPTVGELSATRQAVWPRFEREDSFLTFRSPTNTPFLGKRAEKKGRVRARKGGPRPGSER